MKRMLTALAAISWGASLFAGASIEGNVELPPPRSAAKAERYAITSTPVGKPDPARAVVYLEGEFPRTNGIAKVDMAQKDFQFAPGVLAIQKGTIVEFPNKDVEFHSVFSHSKSKRFDLGHYRKDEKSPALVFDKTGVVKLFCEIHTHMRATILVVDTPYFTTTDPTGKYRLENLPAGKYTLKAWIHDEKIVERPVELKDGETLMVDFK